MADKQKKPNPENENPSNEDNSKEQNTDNSSENTQDPISNETNPEKNAPATKDTLFGRQNVTETNISNEMESSYLEYAMSVIVSRALPDVRDGLKPVHRRILHAMNEMGLRAGGPFRKSAAVVGEVLAKYHPHGDRAVYDSMVRMAQNFAMRYTLVKGQGNFGSIDGDNAAAMRYTEAKMEKITEELLNDIDKETVNWRDNYDGRYKEPAVLPTKIPQLLLNGTTGIAVGMATSIPPHNLGEIIDGLLHLSKNPEASLDDLMQFIKGPDFPTGGILYNISDIKRAYLTGRGGMVIRAKTNISETKGGKFMILVTEIPYQVNKSNLISKIADLVHEKKVIGITDLRDESNKDGIRIVIELKRDSYPKKILNQLFKYTDLQTSFNMNMIALVDEIQPHLLDLKQVLEHFITHRKVIITKRTEYDLKIARERAHILEGLKIALDNIDEVISTIRKSDTKEEALQALMQNFGLTELQGKAILEMRLQTLAGLERKKIEDELAEKLKEIKELEDILSKPERIIKIMQEEMKEIKNKYGDERKTVIIPHAINEISNKDTIPDEPMIVMLSRENYIKRISPTSFKAQHRGGKGIIGGQTKEEDEIKLIRFTNNHDDLLYFTNKGRVFKLPVYEIQKASRTAKGQAIVNLLQLQDGEIVTAILNSKEKFSGKYLMMATNKGTIKKTPVEEFANVRKTGLIAIKLKENESLEWVKQTDGTNEVMLITKEGKSIRFKEEDVRPMGRPSIGVRGMKLKNVDEIIEMDVVKDPKTAELLVVMENGLGKMTLISNYRTQGRGGTGIKTANITTKTGKIIGAKIFEKTTDADLIIISKAGQVIRLHSSGIPSQGRNTQGVYLMRMKSDDKVASISLVDNILDETKPETPAQQAIPEVVVNEG